MRSRAPGCRLPATLSLAAMLLAPVAARGTYSVPAGHPRLLLTAADVGPLQSRCRSDARYTAAYAALKGRVDGWSTPTTNRYVIGAQIQCLVFVTVVENYDATYLAKVDSWMTNLFQTQGAVNLAASGDAGAVWGSADIILGAAMAYDWLHAKLATDKRTQYGTWLRDFQTAVLNEQGGPTRDASRSDYSNQFYYFDGMLGVSGIALASDGIGDATASAWLATFDDDAHRHMLPTVNQVGGQLGGWHEGLGYVDRAMTWFSLELEAWRVGASEDLFPQATGLAGIGRWLFHCTQPDGNVVNIADVSGWPVGWGTMSARRSVLVAARCREPISQYIATQVSPTSGSNWPYIPFYLLWHDPAVAAADPQAVPPVAFFDGIGWATMRENWTATATFATFTCGDYYFGHQHYDQNGFTIFRNAPLGIDNGVYNVGQPSYKTATRYHNTILIGNPGAETAVDDGAAGQGGASPMYYLSDPIGTSSDRGEIIHFEDDSLCTYVAGDASRAYSSSRLTSYVRKFLYLKPSTFVVLDRVVIPSTQYPIRWLLQSDTAPTTATGSFTITNGTGRLFGKTLLPAAVSATTTTTFAGMTEYGGGNYRMEIVPATSRTEEYFLHAIVATESSQGAMPTTELLTSASGDLVGARVGDRVALVAKSGAAGSQESYTVSSAGALTHVIADLSPGAVYDVLADGAPLTSRAASNGGMIRFESPTGGTFTVYERQAGGDIVPPQAPADLRKL